jgi:hypothetical protein
MPNRTRCSETGWFTFDPQGSTPSWDATDDCLSGLSTCIEVTWYIVPFIVQPERTYSGVTTKVPRATVLGRPPADSPDWSKEYGLIWLTSTQDVFLDPPKHLKVFSFS